MQSRLFTTSKLNASPMTVGLDEVFLAKPSLTRRSQTNLPAGKLEEGGRSYGRKPVVLHCLIKIKNMKAIFRLSKPALFLLVILFAIFFVANNLSITSATLADPPPTLLSFKDTDGDKPDTAGCVQQYNNTQCIAPITHVFADLCASGSSTKLFEYVAVNVSGATSPANTCSTGMSSHQYDCYIWCGQQGALSGECVKATTVTCTVPNSPGVKAAYCSCII